MVREERVAAWGLPLAFMRYGVVYTQRSYWRWAGIRRGALASRIGLACLSLRVQEEG